MRQSSKTQLAFSRLNHLCGFSAGTVFSLPDFYSFPLGDHKIPNHHSMAEPLKSCMWLWGSFVSLLLYNSKLFLLLWNFWFYKFWKRENQRKERWSKFFFLPKHVFSRYASNKMVALPLRWTYLCFIYWKCRNPLLKADGIIFFSSAISLFYSYLRFGDITVLL